MSSVPEVNVQRLIVSLANKFLLPDDLLDRIGHYAEADEANFGSVEVLSQNLDAGDASARAQFSSLIERGTRL